MFWPQLYMVGGDLGVALAASLSAPLLLKVA